MLYWTGTLKTAYVYDGRGSVAQALGIGADGQCDSITAKRYTPFGEMIGGKASGYGYNGEHYDAATGMLHLRARQYEPAMHRFSRKDILRGSVTAPLSLNRYAFVRNNPVMFADPSGLDLVSAFKSVGAVITGIVKAVAAIPVVQAVVKAVKTAVNALMPKPVQDAIVHAVQGAARVVVNAVQSASQMLANSYMGYVQSMAANTGLSEHERGIYQDALREIQNRGINWEDPGARWEATKILIAACARAENAKKQAAANSHDRTVGEVFNGFLGTALGMLVGSAKAEEIVASPPYNEPNDNGLH